MKDGHNIRPGIRTLTRARLGGPPTRRRAERPGTVEVIPVFGVLAQRMNAMTEISGGPPSSPPSMS